MAPELVSERHAAKLIREGRRDGDNLALSAAVGGLCMVAAGLAYGFTASPWALSALVLGAVWFVVAWLSRLIDQAFTVAAVAELRARLAEGYAQEARARSEASVTDA
jgi:small-conductance mechanosensitive channel